MTFYRFLFLIVLILWQIIGVQVIHAQGSQRNISVKLMLHGLGKAGDNVAAGAGNPNPQNTTRDVDLELYNSSNQLAKTINGEVSFNSGSGNFQGVLTGSSIPSGLIRLK